ncbi:MAG: hypothetical protein IKR42_00910, partial [Campylobacter sp.]|nr:hypothetical protein [Campylobacter sp.]
HNNFLFKVRAGENGEFKYEFLKDGVFRTNLKGASMIGLEDGLNEIQLSWLFRSTNPNQKLITPLFRLICVWGEMHENWELIPFSIDLPVGSNTLILTKE